MSDKYFYFFTEYFEGEHKFGSYIVARDALEAEIFTEDRQLGEKITSCPTKLTRKLPDPLSKGFPHWLIFVSYIAIKSGKYSPGILSDRGIIHETLHLSYAVKKVKQTKNLDRLSDWTLTVERAQEIWFDFQKLLVTIGFAHEGEITELKYLKL